MSVNNTELMKMDLIESIVNSDSFKDDLFEVENYIVNNYEKLHFMWGIKNKVKLAAERLVRFHIWRNCGLTALYKSPLSSDVAFILNDCVLNVDCKTIDLDGNSNDKKYIQFEPAQANFENIKLQSCEIAETGDQFDGYNFFPQLEKYHNDLPVLSYFIFINYKDNGNTFSIEELEICCLPHDKVVYEHYNKDIIFGFKTYSYMKKLQADKIDEYLRPCETPKPHWIEFKVGRTKRYYDNIMMHPFMGDQKLIWGKESNKFNVCIGGHTTRVQKEKIKYRTNDYGETWEGWKIINI